MPTPTWRNIFDESWTFFWWCFWTRKRISKKMGFFDVGSSFYGRPWLLRLNVGKGRGTAGCTKRSFHVPCVCIKAKSYNSLKLTVRPWKWMVGRWHFLLGWPILSGANMLVSGSVFILKLQLVLGRGGRGTSSFFLVQPWDFLSFLPFFFEKMETCPFFIKKIRKFLRPKPACWDGPETRACGPCALRLFRGRRWRWCLVDPGNICCRGWNLTPVK